METERFEELLKRWQDGEASPSDLGELEAFLRGDARCRRELVHSTLLEVQLCRRYPVSGERVDSATPRIASRRPAPGRKRILEVAAALLVFGVSGVAAGRLFFSTPETAGPSPAAAAPSAPAHPAPQEPTPAPAPAGNKYARRLDRAMLTLSEAVDRAQAAAPGVAYRAVLKDEDGRIQFSVKVAQKSQVADVDLDARTGELLEEPEVENYDLSTLVGATKISLQQAIAAALRYAPGRALEAEFELKSGKPQAEVKVLGDGGVRKVKLDGQTGEIR